MATVAPTKSPPTTRRCCYCKKRKPIEAFGANRFKKWGVQAYCRDCSRSVSRKQIQKYREAHPEYDERRRFEKYGLTKKHFEAMAEAQAHKCAICGEGGDDYLKLHIDHCHDSGAVRGLLCRSCNHGLGMFKDNAASLRSAANYLDGTLVEAEALPTRAP